MINPSLLIIKHQRYNTQNESDEIETGFFFFKFIFLFLTNKKSQTLKQKLKKSTELDSWVEWSKVLKNPQSLFLNITKTVSYLKKDKREKTNLFSSDNCLDMLNTQKLKPKKTISMKRKQWKERERERVKWPLSWERWLCHDQEWWKGKTTRDREYGDHVRGCERGAL